MLIGMRSVADVFRKAREAEVAVVGIGSILTGRFRATTTSIRPRAPTAQAIEQSGATGELLAHLHRSSWAGLRLLRSTVRWSR